MNRTSIPGRVRERLKSYVYLYVDPRTNKPFYVGKGRGARCLAHANGSPGGRRGRIIRELRKLGREPRIEILKYGLSERDAFLVEATAIDLLGLEGLSNKVRGQGCRVGSRGAVMDIVDELSERAVRIREPVVLIKINRAFRFGMTVHEIYDATRSAWKVAPARKKPLYAMSVYRGVVREVFEIAEWVRGGTTMKLSDEHGRAKNRSNRWEFVGQVAEELIRRRYKGRLVEGYFRKGAQNPIKYVNCG